MEQKNDFAVNAEIAYANKQYEEALKWYEKALSEKPDDLYLLSRLGSLCVPLERYDDALRYFGKAKDLDPANGDNFFNYANACFFNNRQAEAFAMYVEAERVGCSEDVTPRLYYQLGLLCSMRQDVKSALIYFKKCEAADKEGTLSLNPDLISEKLKLALAVQNYTDAEKYAAQLVAIQPTVFKNYMIYFSVLMGHRQYDTAEKLLKAAEQYAELDDENRFSLVLQQAALLTAKAEKEPERKSAVYAEAAELLENYRLGKALDPEHRCQLMMALAETYMKDGQYDKAIKYLGSLLLPPAAPESAPVGQPADVNELTPGELDELINADIETINEALMLGTLDPDILEMQAETYYDEEGNEHFRYPEQAFAFMNPKKESGEEETAASETPGGIAPEIREKICFDLLSAYLGKEDFVGAERFAGILKHSENRYYQYYGLYVVALSAKKLGKAEAGKRYDEAIAFFRGKTLNDPKDTLACIFRARLYAEQGKSEKAKELAALLSDADRESVLTYIRECTAQ